MKRFLLSALFLASLFTTAVSADTVTPVPDSAVLFHIERSINLNEVYYVLSITGDGSICPRKPVQAYWIMWEKDSTGKTCEKLNPLEKLRAYGFKVGRERNGNALTMRLSVFPSRPIKVYLRNGRAVAETMINGRPCRLEKIHVNAERKKLLPKVDSIVLYGTSIESGEATRENLL